MIGDPTKPTPQDPNERDERIRRRAHQIWEEAGRPDGKAQEHWERAAADLDREDAAIRREGIEGDRPGVKSVERPGASRPDKDKA